MRIISGKAKGKKIHIPENNKTRPLKDMVRESIFNILEHSNLLNIKFSQSIVLDLFSGVGSFGLEAISRGAKKVLFFENYKPALNMLTKNIDALSFNQDVEINIKDIYDEKTFLKLNYKFDLVFIDPPFKDEKIEIILKNLENSKKLTKKTLLIIHRHKKTKNILKQNFKNLREEIYGSSKIIFGNLTI
tara:strand:+ start:431 stop:997 length:567 start_codon:yes stop_codon:yes gene_type:complete